MKVAIAKEEELEISHPFIRFLLNRMGKGQRNKI